MLVELTDGGIKEIYADTDSYSGCETCDYGSSYINEYVIQMTKGELKVEVNQMYEHALSEGDMMKLMLTGIDEIKALSEDEFVEWVKVNIDKLAQESAWGDAETKFEYTSYTVGGELF